MQTDPLTDWQRLTEHYRAMWDDELLNLAADADDLTEMARQVLKDEMRKRGLELPRADSSATLPAGPAQRPVTGTADAQEDEPGADDAPEDGLPVEYTWKTELCECGTREEAWQVFEMLRRAGIESWIGDPSSRFSSLDMTGHKVLVAADQLDQARLVAAGPVPQDIIDESQPSAPEEYALPVCPKCGVEDPLLDGVDPVNSWECEACGHKWSDPAEG